MKAQGFQQPAPAAEPVHKTDDPLLRNFTWRAIGPANMGGRIDDIAVVESNPSIYYVAFATGGLWKTVNNGTTWTPIFEKEGFWMRAIRDARSRSSPFFQASARTVETRMCSRLFRGSASRPSSVKRPVAVEPTRSRRRDQVPARPASGVACADAAVPLVVSPPTSPPSV